MLNSGFYFDKTFYGLFFCTVGFSVEYRRKKITLYIEKILNVTIEPDLDFWISTEIRCINQVE